MNKAIDYIKIPSLCLATLIAGSALLSACNIAPEGNTTTTTEEVTTTTIKTSEMTWDTQVNPKNTTTYEKIELDGNPDHYFTVYDYSYVESDKYILLLEKDVRLPGDFVVTLDAIVNEIEKQMGISANPVKYTDSVVPEDMNWHYGDKNPWEGWIIDTKIPIFVCADYTDEDIGCIGNQDYVRICLYDLMTKEALEALPRYKKKITTKLGYVDYVEITEILARHIAFRNYGFFMPGIISEGIGNYMSYTVVDALAEQHANIKTAKKKKYRYDAPISEVVNAKNAEEVFATDYTYDEYVGSDGNIYTDYAVTYSQEVYGRYFCRFLKEEYGDDFYKRLNDGLNEYGESRNYVWIVKNTFGDDVFTKFGDWCVKHKALQKKNGVYP